MGVTKYDINPITGPGGCTMGVIVPKFSVINQQFIEAVKKAGMSLEELIGYFPNPPINRTEFKENIEKIKSSSYLDFDYQKSQKEKRSHQKHLLTCAKNRRNRKRKKK